MINIRDHINITIMKFGDEFIKDPFLHRVEHSMHCELYQMLTSSITEQYQSRYILNKNGFRSQLIHKEWPHQDNIDKGHRRRGNYDLVILDKKSLKQCTLDQYRLGRNVVLNTVIELGLNYDTNHLLKDCKTLNNTKSKNKWIIHFRNIKSRDTEVAKHSQIINALEEKYMDISFLYIWVIFNNGKIKILKKEAKIRT
jgi:hypothetical protein